MYSLRGVSEEIGVVKRFYFPPRAPYDPVFHTCVMEGGELSFLLHAPVSYSVSAGGYSRQLDQAFLGLMGETLERYASAFPCREEIVRASYEQLCEQGKLAVNPAEVALFHPSQYERDGFAYRPFRASTLIDWVPTTQMCTGQTIYYPASLIYMPYWLCEPAQMICPSQSTGLAAHTNPAQALLLGLYEVIERDGFAISWHQALPLQKFHTQGWIAHRIEQYFGRGVEVHLLDISLDWGVPVAVGLVYTADESGDIVVCASACRSTWAECIDKVLRELAQGIPYARFLRDKYANWQPAPDFSDVSDFDMHAALYHKDKTLWQGLIQQWRQTPARLPVPDEGMAMSTPGHVFRDIARSIHRKGYDIVAKEVSTPDCEQLGYRVLRVQIPQATPLGGSVNAYFLGAKRLYEVPQRLGLPVRPFEALNVHPHLFP